MVLCCNCGKSFKSHKGISWEVGMCKRCYNQPQVKESFPYPMPVVRKIFRPTDSYLDIYTPQEIRNLDN